MYKVGTLAETSDIQRLLAVGSTGECLFGDDSAVHVDNGDGNLALDARHCDSGSMGGGVGMDGALEVGIHVVYACGFASSDDQFSTRPIALPAGTTE